MSNTYKARFDPSSGQVIDLPHFQQQYSWDCGLACTAMVLSHCGRPTSELYTVDMAQQQCGESVWTIDLAYIVSRYGIPHRLCTVTLGANSDHASKPFYTGFSRDEERVNQLFTKAAAEGVHVEQCSLGVEQLLSHLRDGNVAVVLSDCRYLQCVWCEGQMAKCLLCCVAFGHLAYQGHFIVVCGFDEGREYIFYKNPNKSESLCCCPFQAFDKARRASGTDEDILFIYKQDQVFGQD